MPTSMLCAFTASPLPAKLSSHDWLADSATSSHIAYDIRMFSSLTPSHITVKGVGSAAFALGRGSVTLTSKINDESVPITLHDVIYAPSAPNCLLSLGRVHRTPGTKVHWNDDCTILIEKSGKSAIGSLMYAAIATRPDIAYAVNSLSQFNVKPSWTHWNAVKHVLRYLHGTKSLAQRGGNGISV